MSTDIEKRLDAIEKSQATMEQQVSAVIKHINNELTQMKNRSSNQAIRKIAREAYAQYETDLGALTRDAQKVIIEMNKKATALTLEETSEAINGG